MKKNILHLLYFLSIILILIISIKFADESDNDAFRYKNFFNLGKLNNDDILVNFAITRQAWGNIRLGYLEEKKEKNKVLVLGNHTINNFTISDFGKNLPRNYFYNNWYANLGLPEIRDLIFHLDEINKLPEELLVVQITTPHNDNGNHIIAYGSELPIGIRLKAQKYFKEKYVSFLKSTYFQYLSIFKYMLDFSNVMLIGTKNKDKVMVVTEENCKYELKKNKDNSFFSKLPLTIQHRFNLLEYRDFCSKQYLKWGIKYDGSRTAHQRKIVYRPKNIDPLTAKLKRGDEKLIEKYVLDIQDFVKKKEFKTVFLVVPFYEPINTTSVIDQIFTRGVNLTKQKDENILWIDHRHYNTDDKEMFYAVDHPSDKYYKDLVQIIRSKGLISF